MPVRKQFLFAIAMLALGWGGHAIAQESQSPASTPTISQTWLVPHVKIGTVRASGNLMRLTRTCIDKYEALGPAPAAIPAGYVRVDLQVVAPTVDDPADQPQEASPTLDQTLVSKLLVLPTPLTLKKEGLAVGDVSVAYVADESHFILLRDDPPPVETKPATSESIESPPTANRSKEVAVRLVADLKPDGSSLISRIPGLKIPVLQQKPTAGTVVAQAKPTTAGPKSPVVSSSPTDANQDGGEKIVPTTESVKPATVHSYPNTFMGRWWQLQAENPPLANFLLLGGALFIFIAICRLTNRDRRQHQSSRRHGYHYYIQPSDVDEINDHET